MAFKSGQSGNPKGRPKGSKNKKDEMIANLSQQAIDGGILPLDFFLSNLRNESLPLGFRYENAKAAGPYVHRKMPIAIENADAPFKVFDMSMLAGLNDAELAVVEKLMAKAQERALGEHKREERAPLGPLPAPKGKPASEAPPPPAPPAARDVRGTVDKPKPVPKKKSWES